LGGEWAQTLEDLECGFLRFERVYPGLQAAMEDSLHTHRECGQRLTQLVNEMRQAFKLTLKRVNDSGNFLLSAAGDLQRNRNIVFKMVPTTSRGSRQAAEELMLCRTSVLQAVEANGQVLLSMRSDLQQSHNAVAVALKDSLTAVQCTMDLLDSEREIVQLARERCWLLQEMAGSSRHGLDLCSRLSGRTGFCFGQQQRK